MAQVEVKCFSCNDVSVHERVGFRAECICGEDLHVCLNCRFYDETSYNECKEPTADRIKTKDRSNLCEFFEASTGGGSDSKKNDDLLAAAEALFKK